MTKEEADALRPGDKIRSKKRKIVCEIEEIQGCAIICLPRMTHETGRVIYKTKEMLERYERC
jgi:hypothetical protein